MDRGRSREASTRARVPRGGGSQLDTLRTGNLQEGARQVPRAAARTAAAMIPGADTGERFSVVEHPLPPRALAAPLHLHTREDEYSFVLEGRMGALLGDDVLEAGPGGSACSGQGCRTNPQGR